VSSTVLIRLPHADTEFACGPAVRHYSGVWGCGRQSAARGSCGSELFNRDGWEIPGLKRSVAERSGLRVTGEGIPAGVVADKLKPKSPEALLTIVFCQPDHPGRIEVRKQPVDVQEVWRYSLNGRVFAYRVVAGWVGIDGRKRYGIGTAEMLVFYDEDGSGRFSIQRNAATVPFKLDIPAWVVSARDGPGNSARAGDLYDKPT
jgi:hypothetical protein